MYLFLEQWIPHDLDNGFHFFREQKYHLPYLEKGI